jgi:hypothetical protein
MLQRCSRDVPEMFQRCSRDFQRCSRDNPEDLLGRFVP